MKPRQCHEPYCDELAAWGASKKPAWCQKHAVEKFREQGLEPLEPVEKRTTFTLTRCLTCGCEAHYRLEYALSHYDSDEKTCRACYWKSWATHASRYSQRSSVDLKQIQKLAESNEYEYLGPLTNPSLDNDPHHVRCNHCGRLSAQRPGDIGWGCGCQRRSRRAASASKTKGPKILLKDSDHDALKWWDHDRNAASSFETATLKATREASWVCPTCGHRFVETVRRMTDMYPTCPQCEQRRVTELREERNRFKNRTISEVPELLAAWADDSSPKEALVLSNFPLRRFRCPKGHLPKTVPYTYLKHGCPSCRANETRIANQIVPDAAPNAFRLDPEMASQWHPTANRKLDVRTISPRSRRQVTWLCTECGHTWMDSPKSRSYASALRCPECRSIFDSLAYHHPDLAAEWSADNPKTAWQIRPSSTIFTPTWVCATEPSHVFTISLAARSNGGMCPECSEHGKSRVELAHYQSAKKQFGNVSSGKTFTIGSDLAKRKWRVDISIERADGALLIVEYDGAYWHRNKSEVDVRKSKALLNAGYRVVRLREYPLEPLPIVDDNYFEISVHSAAPDPDRAIDQIRRWLG